MKNGCRGGCPSCPSSPSSTAFPTAGNGLRMAHQPRGGRRPDARQAQKLLLLNFSASDWCGWCQRLAAEVFSPPAFRDFAAASRVLVLDDFPPCVRHQMRIRPGPALPLESFPGLPPPPACG